jgi:hypothetical protein
VLATVQGLICLCLLWYSVHCDSRFHFFHCGKLAISHFLPLGFFLSVFLTDRSIAPTCKTILFNLISEIATYQFLDLIVVFIWYIHIMLLCTFTLDIFSVIYKKWNYLWLIFLQLHSSDLISHIVLCNCCTWHCCKLYNWFLYVKGMGTKSSVVFLLCIMIKWKDTIRK